MTLVVASIIVFTIGLGSVVWSIARTRAVPSSTAPKNAVLGRLDRYIAQNDGAASVATGSASSGVGELVASLRKALAERDDRAKGKNKAQDALAEDLLKADIPFRPTEWRIACALSGVLTFLVLGLRVNLILGLVVAPAVAVFGGRFLLKFRLRRRSRKFDEQLGDVILMLSSSLRAGYSFAQAMMHVSTNAPNPVAGEFARTSRELQLGLSVEEALRRMVARNESEDLDLMMTAVQIHRVVGGNLTEILDTIAETIRERVRIQGEIRTLTAQARASGWIISLLPIALAGILTLVAPTYFNQMFQKLPGILMLVFALISMSIGILIIKKIVAIRI